jgi:Caspase domain.
MNKTAILLILCAASFHYVCAERYAILVGNSTASGNFSPLKYVENDLNLLQGILGDFCGFEKQRVLTLYNGTPADLDKMLSEVAAGMSKTGNNMFLFYYSGHADQANLKMGGSLYPLASLKEKLTAFPSDIRIGIFDACQSGSFTQIKGGTLDEPFLFRDDGKTKGQVILCSSSINENAQEFDAYGNSVFTFHFVNALRGSGDLSGDGKVTLSEAYQYAYNHTLSSTAGSSGGIQHPSYQFRIQGEGDIVLADLNVRICGIMLGADVTGNVTIFNEKSNVVADLAKERNSAIMLALNPGAYRVVKTNVETRTQASVLVNDRSITHLKSGEFSSIPSSENGQKGNSQRRMLQAGISVFGALEKTDFSSLKSDVQGLFKDYNSFSIDPTFSFPRNVINAGVTFEVIARNNYEGHIGFGIFNFSNSLDYHGTRLNEFDNKTYGCKLHTEYSFSAVTTDFGTGYRFSNGYLKNVYCGVGIVIYEIRFELNSRFTYSLFNMETSGNQVSSGSLGVPYIAAGYTWPFSRFCDIGTKLRYRYQKSPSELDNGSGEVFAASEVLPLHYNFKGIDACLFINFHFTINKTE